ncbi:MAG: (2Fe-2S)-binding protein [Acidimicrobiales bacterium]
MTYTFDFDHRPVVFRPGQSIGAALIAAGIRSWRTTRRESRPRGIFCGIGICFDCLVTVDGTSNQRACLVAATPGMDIRSQQGSGHADLAI